MQKRRKPARPAVHLPVCDPHQLEAISSTGDQLSVFGQFEKTNTEKENARQ
jgi:hypothetical protein